jgi:hypothetical protein
MGKTGIIGIRGRTLVSDHELGHGRYRWFSFQAEKLLVNIKLRRLELLRSLEQEDDELCVDQFTPTIQCHLPLCVSEDLAAELFEIGTVCRIFTPFLLRREVYDDISHRLKFLAKIRTLLINIMVRLAELASGKTTFLSEERFFEFHGTGRPPKFQQVLSMDLVPAI